MEAMCERYGWTINEWEEQDWETLQTFVEIINCKAIKEKREQKRAELKNKHSRR